jgi:hypothetical protein
VNDSNEGCADTTPEHARRIRTAARGIPPGARLIDPGAWGATVKRAAAPAPVSPQRTIGEILLEHGYVTEEDLDTAIQRQQETGFPLGQILVEAGAITRLELASALAVQWADVTPAKPPTDETRGRARPNRDTETRFDEQLFAYSAPPPDDAWRDEVRGAARAFAQRLDALEIAVDELREETDDDTTVEIDVEGAIAPVAGRLDEALQRVATLEAVLAETRNGQHQALAALAEVREDLARRAASVTTALEALSEQVGQSAPAHALDELRAAVDTLAAHSNGDAPSAAALEAIAGRVDLLSAQVEALADPTALEELRRALDSLAERPASDPILAGRLEELAARVAALAERSVADPELAARLDELTARPVVDSAIDDRLDELAGRLEEVALRPEADPAAATRLEELTARIERLPDPAALDELRCALDALAERPEPEPVLAGRVEELAAQVEALAQAPAVDPDLVARVDALTARVDARPDTQSGEQPSGAVDELAARVAVLEATITALADRPEGTAPAAPSEARDGSGTGEISGREFDRLCFAVERLSLQLTEHHRAIDLLMNGDGAGATDGQLEALVARLGALEARGVAPRPAGSKDAAAAAAGEGAAVHSELHELAKRIAEIDEASRIGREKLLTQIEQMMSSIDWRFQRLESGGKAA